jgi:hypothetical protein
MTTNNSQLFTEHFLRLLGLTNLTKHYERVNNITYPLLTSLQPAKFPLIFPRVEAFLYSDENFTWAVEIYDVEGEGTETDLTNKSIGTFIVKGLKIKSQESKTITIKDNMERGIDFNGTNYPTGISYYETNNDTPHRLNGERERTISVTGDDLGLPGSEDLPDDFNLYGSNSFYEGNKIPHGQLLDMAIYIYD